MMESMAVVRTYLASDSLDTDLSFFGQLDFLHPLLHLGCCFGCYGVVLLWCDDFETEFFGFGVCQFVNSGLFQIYDTQRLHILQVEQKRLDKDYYRHSITHLSVSLSFIVAQNVILQHKVAFLESSTHASA